MNPRRPRLKNVVYTPFENLVWPPGCKIQYPDGYLATPQEFTWAKGLKAGGYQVWGPQHEDWGVITISRPELN